MLLKECLPFNVLFFRGRRCRPGPPSKESSLRPWQACVGVSRCFSPDVSADCLVASVGGLLLECL